jgi:cytochrome c6
MFLDYLSYISFRIQFLTGGFKEESVVTQVTNGKGAMPAFGGRLTDEDIANVATYVITKSGEGWD